MKCRKCGSYTDKRFCPDCGTDLLQRRRKKPKQSKAVSTTKLVLGIVSIVLFIFSMLQSCAVTSLGALVSEETVASGLIGILLSFSLLIAGIVGISTREKPIGSLIAAVIWIIGSFIGFAGSDGAWRCGREVATRGCGTVRGVGLDGGSGAGAL